MIGVSIFLTCSLHARIPGYIQRDENYTLTLTFHKVNTLIVVVPQNYKISAQEKTDKRAMCFSWLWETILATDLTVQVQDLDIPVYFFHGIYDYTVSYSLAQNYFEKLKAPLKGFYTFKHSAHSPIFEQPGIANQIIKNDVL